MNLNWETKWIPFTMKVKIIGKWVDLCLMRILHETLVYLSIQSKFHTIVSSPFLIRALHLRPLVQVKLLPKLGRFTYKLESNQVRNSSIEILEGKWEPWYSLDWMIALKSPMKHKGMSRMTRTIFFHIFLLWM